jgi:hypothetical protein
MYKSAAMMHEQHHPGIYTVTHTVSGTHVCAACSFTAQDSIVLIGFPGVIYADVVTGAATCAAGGWHYVKKFLDLTAEWAITYTQVLPNQPTYVWVNVIPWCSNAYPTVAVYPDWDPQIAGPNIAPPTAILYGLGFVGRNKTLGIGWHQIGPGFFYSTAYLPTDPKRLCRVTP